MNVPLLYLVVASRHVVAATADCAVWHAGTAALQALTSASGTSYTGPALTLPGTVEPSLGWVAMLDSVSAKRVFALNDAYLSFFAKDLAGDVGVTAAAPAGARPGGSFECAWWALRGT